MSTRSFCTYNQGLLQSNVTAVWSQEHYRKPHPKFESTIEEYWNVRMKENINLFDKSKFRLHDYAVDDNKKPSRLTLYLGLTSYKDFVGTNCSPYSQELLKEGITHHGCSKVYLANPLGIGALVETADSMYVLMKRSLLCAESPGLLDRPGGHPEPDNITEATGDRGFGFLEPSLFVHEIFQSVIKEIEDEINIPEDKLSVPILLGIGFNDETCNRPTLEFHVKCSLSSDEVLAKYNQQTQAEKEESTGLIFIPKQELLKAGHSQHDLSNKFTNSMKSAIFLLNVFTS